MSTSRRWTPSDLEKLTKKLDLGANKAQAAEILRGLATAGAAKGNKHHAIPCVIDGHRFASRREGKVYEDLVLLARAGQIAELELHPCYDLVVDGVLINTYTADFRYRENGELVVVDVKSPDTASKRDFRRNCRLMKALHQIDVKIVY